MSETATPYLHWVGQELAVAMRDARNALEQYSETTEREFLIQCADTLHGAHGALQMVEVYGAALLAEEMVHVARGLADGGIKEEKEALDALSNAMVQMPAYLDRVLNGSRDVPIVLLPLLNDLRAVRGSPLLSESSLFVLNLSTQRPENEQVRPAEPSGEDIQFVARRLRPRYQAGLLGFLRGEQLDTNLATMGVVVGALEDAATATPVFQFWWVVGAVIEALREDGLKPSASVKRLLARADRHVKELIAAGEAGWAESASSEALDNLLFYVARATSSGPKVTAVKSSFSLAELLPADENDDDGTFSLSAPSVTLMKTVAAAIKQDLGSVKDVLDIHVRTGASDRAELAPQLDVLKKIGNTLGMLGLDDLKATAQQQVEQLEALVGSTDGDDAALLAIAEALLNIEDRLDTQLLDVLKPGEPAAESDGEDDDTDFQQVASAVLRECMVNLARVKESIAHFVSDPEQGHAIDGVPGLLTGINAGLLMLSKDRAVSVLERIGAYVRANDDGALRSADKLDRLADSIVSVEYYMETLQNGRSDPWYMLDNAERCLDDLGVPDKPAEAQAPAPEPVRTPVSADELPPQTPLAPPKKRPTAAVDAPMIEDARMRVDPELVELFIEEAKEEIESITEVFADWLDKPDNRELLLSLRRSFHTLKGSGRMVGAQLIGDFAWSIENLLNKLINGTLAPSAPITSAATRGVEALPELVEQLEVGTEPTSGIEALMDEAWRLAESSPHVPPSRQPEPTAEPAAAQADDEPAGMDPVLYDIFSKETAEHLASIDDWVAACDSSSAPYPVTAELHRAWHTLRGTANTADVSAAARIAAPLDRYVRKHYEADFDLPPDAVTLFRDASAALADIVRAAGDDSSAIPEYPDIASRIEALDERFEAFISAQEADTAATEAEAEATEEAAAPPVDEAAEAVDATPADAETAGETAGQAADEGFFDVGEADAAAEPGDIVEAADDVAAAGETAAADTAVDEAPAHAEEFDAEIAAIFGDEATELLDACDATLQTLVDQPRDAYAIAELQRHLHTLKGGARMAGISAMGDLSHELETLVRNVGEGLRPADATVIELLQESVDKLHGMREQLAAQLPVTGAPALLEKIASNALEASAAEAAGAQTEAAAAAEAPPAAVESPVAATDEAMPEAVAEPVTDAVADEDTETAGETAEAADTPAPAEELAEASADEDVVADEPAAEDAGEVAEETAADAVEETAVETTEAADDEGTLADVVPFADSGRARDEAPAADADSAAPPAAAPRPPAADERAADRQDVARVSADLLDDLLNNAGEISIYHSRLEQQLSSIGFNLSELNTTVARLRGQLRNMEIETEAQMLFRHQEEGDTKEHFDPLELDRYSTVQQLSRALAESVSDLTSIQELLTDLSHEASTLLVQQSRVTTELQDGLMRTRMVPFQRNVPRLGRLVRQTAAECDKRVELRVEGSAGELDRQVLERMLPPLEHMLRNAIVHGIEAPDERERRGKSPVGEICIRLHREGSQMVIEVQDDGAGFDVAAITERARSRGMLDADAELTESDVLQLIVAPGFSTARTLTQSAGRGVGMDVVANEVKQLGGTLDIEPRTGKGARFVVRLPQTLAISQALLVRTGDDLYAIPLPTVEGIVRVPRAELEDYLSDDERSYEYGGQRYRFQHLGVLLGGHAANLEEAGSAVPVILVRAGEHSTALIADEMLGSREVVVKPVGPQISGIRGIAGATILGDGSIVIILDVSALVRTGLKTHTAPPPEQGRRDDERSLIMVVDDSITVRRVTQRLLERNDMRVLTAKDGVDAVSLLQEHEPDLMLLDIEMPRMDGYEVATHVRNSARLQHIPIVMVTSRVGEKHRARAFELGVDAYLGKPYQETQLLETIDPLLARVEQ